jgi:hypothetical protein
VKTFVAQNAIDPHAVDKKSAPHKRCLIARAAESLTSLITNGSGSAVRIYAAEFAALLLLTTIAVLPVFAPHCAYFVYYRQNYPRWLLPPRGFHCNLCCLQRCFCCKNTKAVKVITVKAAESTTLESCYLPYARLESQPLIFISLLNCLPRLFSNKLKTFETEFVKNNVCAVSNQNSANIIKFGLASCFISLSIDVNVGFLDFDIGSFDRIADSFLMFSNIFAHDDFFNNVRFLRGYWNLGSRGYGKVAFLNSRKSASVAVRSTE